MAGAAPNARTWLQSGKFSIYYRCMVVMFASARRAYPHARLALFTNTRLPAPFEAELQALGVVRLECEGRYVTDSSFHSSFPGCTYTLDVLRDFPTATQFSECKVLLLLDSDCIVRQRFDDTIARVSSGSLAGYALPYPLNHLVNGHTRASLSLVRAQTNRILPAEPIRYFGGEFYGLPTAELPDISVKVSDLWGWLRGDGAADYGRELTEEHILTVVLGMYPERVY